MQSALRFRHGLSIARVWIATGVWLVLAVTGSAVLTRYAYQPSMAAEPPAEWPRGTSIRRAAEGATLVMMVHPQCGCTPASLEELARLMARNGGRVEAHVVFLLPEGYAEGWARTGLWKSAREIPGVDTSIDAGGREIARFGAWTSGQTLLYDAAGALRFSGGITEARGHAGDNPGLDALERALRPGIGPALRSAVFGCSLRTRRGDS
jgi:hypothetical protein